MCVCVCHQFLFELKSTFLYIDLDDILLLFLIEIKFLRILGFYKYKLK